MGKGDPKEEMEAKEATKDLKDLKDSKDLKVLEKDIKERAMDAARSAINGLNATAKEKEKEKVNGRS